MDEKLKWQLELGFGFILLVIFLTFLLIGLSYPPRPRELPLLVDSIGILLLLVHLGGVLRYRPDPDKKSGKAWNWKVIFICFGSMVLYLFSTYFIGMVLSSAIIIYGCGMAIGAKSKGKMAITALLTVLFIYLLFVRALGIALHRGILFEG